MFFRNRAAGYFPILLLTLPLLVFSLVSFAPDLPVSLAQGLSSLDKIESTLLDQLAVEGTADFIVQFAEQADLSPAYSMSWQERGEFVVRALTEAAQRSQARAKALLDGLGLRYHTFIAGNELYVWQGDLASAQALAGLPEVAFIRATRVYSIDPIIPSEETNAAPQSLDWGIVDTRADDFWTQFGVQGDGIVVANIDTGVQWNHPALDQAYRCPANPTDPSCWYDPTGQCGGTVCDNNGHGTHTMGTMVGDDDPSLPYQVGMAPNARWIACKGCRTNQCYDSDLNACADWILQPGGNPANRPHVVNNSWGGPGCDTWYLSKVNAWRAAGIFPAFSAGNDGPSCSTLGSPGIYQQSFASAAHDSSRNIASFSSRGPASSPCDPHTPYTKPNISAPGVNICSSVPTNSWNCTYSGTSMASPHSAGAVALLWSCNSSLIGQIDQTFQILQNNADSPPAGNCGAPPDGEGNYTYGYGYLNVYQAGLAACGTLQAPTLYDPGEYSTSGNYTVDWTDVSGADSYLLQEDDNPSFNSPTGYTTSSSQYSFSGKADGYYYYRVAAKKGAQTSPWSNTVDIVVDKTPPSNPSSLWSPSHSPYTWSNDNTVDVSWSGAWDNLSGVYGYSIEWSTSPDTLPDTTVDTTGSSATSPPLPDGNSWYFHLRTRDVAGNWNAGAVHLGPFYIDASPPSNPDAWSTSHYPYTWSNDNTVDMAWNGAWDGMSGVAGYSIEWSTTWDTLPDTTIDLTGTSATSPPLPDGSSWYFHLRTADNAGNWNAEAVHRGPYYIDTSPPSNPTWCSESHGVSSGLWQNFADDPYFSWGGAWDAASGIAGYYLYWGTDPNGTSDYFQPGETFDPWPVPSPSTYYLRVAARDNAGNPAPWTTLFVFRYDASPPSNPDAWSTSHSPYSWSNDNTVDMAWNDAWDGEGSGVAGYSIEWSTTWDTLPNTTIDLTGTSATSPPLPDGNSWYFHLRTADNTGNWNAEAVHRGPYSIDTTAPESSVEPLPAQSPTSFLVRWSGSDSSPGSGLATYDVQYRIGPYGVWTDWLVGTTLTSATFGPGQPVPPQPGQTYYFRCRARDQVGNLEAYPDGDGDTWTTIQVQAGYRLYLPLVWRHHAR